MNGEFLVYQVGQYLKNIFEEVKLDQNSVVKNFFTTARREKRFSHYELETVYA